MNGETTDILFHIIYQEQECTLELFKYDTVGHLKNKIFKNFGLAPCKQIIECWHKIPENDSNTLLSCCIEKDVNVLVVYNVENIFQTSRTSRENNERFEPSEVTVNETQAILSFVQYFSISFSNRGITFHICCLQEALSKAFQKKQVLLLYLHNASENFSKFFCEQLVKPDVQGALSNVFLLCWDIEKNEYTEILIEVLHSRRELKSFDRFITNKVSIAIVIIPEENSIQVLSVLKEGMSPSSFLTTLQQAQEMLPSDNDHLNENQRSNFGTKEYQQVMLDMLGDRDYDSFEYYEHEFLKEKIAYATYGPPETEEGYSKDKHKKIDFLFNVIIEQSYLITKWKDRVIISFIYVCTEPLPEEKQNRARKFENYDPDCDLTPFPLFILRKCKHSNNPCRVIIDDVGRVYHCWNDYLRENKLPKCEMIFPKDGRYRGDESGNVILERQLSPECRVTNAILKGTDIASAVGGIASGGVMIAAASLPAVAAAPVVVPAAVITGAALGVYSLGRSAFGLYDRHKHRESLNFFESPEARGAYINIVAGALGFAGAGANMVVSKLAAQGVNIGTGATATVNTINIVNLGVGGAGIANSSYEVVRNWMYEKEKPSLLTIVQLSSSILFFGHAVYNYKSVGTIVDEAQANTLRDFKESLRSNRHRKTFNKLMKETIRQNEGNIQRGQAEVISTIRNIKNKDEVFATLTRTNKAMHRNNVRFAAVNGEISLNGVPVDMITFAQMEKNEVITFLTRLPNTPNPTTADINNMSVTIRNSFYGINASQIATLAVGLVKLFGSTDLTIQEKIISAVSEMIQYLLTQLGFMEELDRIFSSVDKYFRLINMVNGYFQSLINVVEDQYQRWLETRDPGLEEPYFLRLSLDYAKRATELFNLVSEAYFTGTKLNTFGLKKLQEYFVTWFTNQVYLYQERQQRRDQRREHSQQPRPRKRCPDCGGYFYKLS